MESEARHRITDKPVQANMIFSSRGIKLYVFAVACLSVMAFGVGYMKCHHDTIDIIDEAQAQVLADNRRRDEIIDSLLVECKVNRRCWSTLAARCIKAGVITRGELMNGALPE